MLTMFYGRMKNIILKYEFWRRLRSPKEIYGCQLEHLFALEILNKRKLRRAIASLLLSTSAIINIIAVFGMLSHILVRCFFFHAHHKADTKVLCICLSSLSHSKEENL